jgi:hypothetical protein
MLVAVVDDRLPEIVDALDMPREALRRWLERQAAFCRAHGEAHYRELLELLERALKTAEPR